MEPSVSGERSTDNPDFLQPWSRAILMFCILTVGFVIFRLWPALFPDEDASNH